MAAQRHSDPAAQVRAWHNRHPLAERIALDEVVGLGWVVLPFATQAAAVAAGGASDGPAPVVPAKSLRERAMARSSEGAAQEPAEGEATAPPEPPPQPLPLVRDRKGLRRAFSEDLLPPLKPEHIARFVLRHGQQGELPEQASPRREVLHDASLVPAGWGLSWLHLQSAAIEHGTRRVRVLLADPDSGAVLGQRLYSRRRMALAGAVPLVLAAGLAAWLWTRAQPASLQSTPPNVSVLPQRASPQEPASAPAASGAPSAAASTALAASAAASAASGMPGTALAPAHGAAAVPAAAPAAASAAPAPSPASAATAAAGPAPGVTSAQPEASAASGPIRPRLDPEVARAARRESQALRAASAAGRAATEAAFGALEAPARHAKEPAREAAPALGGRVFALVARTTKSRAASEILASAMVGETGKGTGAPRAEVLPAEGGYRASLWPFATREQAERAQRRLRDGGLETLLVEF